MNKKIRILHLEDLSTDAELVERVITKSGINFEKINVSNITDFENKLIDFNPNIVLSDHSLGAFDSIEAFEIFKQKNLKIPFIMVTATMSEEFAVDRIKRGVNDYVLKDRLQRLPNAIINALEKNEIEKQREFDRNNLDALINSTSDLMWSVDRDYKLITFNKPLFDIIKLTSGVELKKEDYILPIALNAEQAERFKYGYDRAFLGESIVEIIYYEKPSESWAEISYYPIKNGNDIIGAVCHSRNITTLKKAEQLLIKSEIFNRGVLNSLSAHIAVINETGEIIAVNESWNRFAIDNNETTLARTGVGNNYFNVCEKSDNEGDEYANTALKGIKNVLFNSIPDLYLEYPCHSPEKHRWFGMRVTKFDNVEPFAVISHQDITKRKLAEDERDKMIEEIIQRNKVLNQFTHIVSHNLRAPVANILGISEFLKGEVSDIDRMQINEFLIESVRHLDEIVKDMNDILHKRLAISEHKEFFKLSKILHTVMENLDDLIKEANISIDIDFSGLESIKTIRSYLINIFQHLISNSIKFRQTQIKTEIKIKSSLVDDKVYISIKDNGIGIDMKQNGEKLFELYKRFHPKIEGKGIGLFMVKTQVEVLGGKIRAISELNIGTEFIIELPV